MVIGATLQCSAFSLGHLIAGRVITGFGNGMNTSTVPTWQSETSKSHRRGQMVMIEGALITGGVCLSYWLDFGFSYLEPSTVSWRFPIAFQIFFALIILIFILPLPESPRWLIMKGKEEEAIQVLCALNGRGMEDPYIESEFAAIKDAVLEMQQGGWKDLFTMGEDRNLHRVILAYVNQMFQQISGINLITYYAANIYEQYIGLSPFISRILAAANGTEYFAASWIAVFTIEKFGRRALMLFGAAGMSLSMIVLAATTSVGGTGPGWVAAVFLFIFNTFFAIGWLGMTWLYPAEIVPLRIRAPANALATSANWAFNFMVVMVGFLPYYLHRQTSMLTHLTGYARVICHNRLPNLHHLRRNQRLHRPSSIFLLPRDRIPVPRRDGPHFPQSTKRLESYLRCRQNRQQGAAYVRKEWRTARPLS